MALILGKIWDAYQFLFEDLPDPRTKEWFLAAKPYEGLTLLGLYLMFVLKWGPKFMKNREPFNIDKIMIAYNAFQVVICVYLFVNAINLAWGWDYKWFCEPVDFSYTAKAIEIARFTYYYYIIKIIDLLDTVFFVLRKKFNQISFLHIYHHTGMVLLIWGAATYFPGGHGTLIGVINSFVHAVMYSYYLLTVAMPSIKNAIWIKKHVTQLQILQFFLMVAHMTVIVFKTDCEYPRWTSALFLPQNIFMLVLFTDFYIKTYIKNPKLQQKIAVSAKNVQINDNNNLQKVNLVNNKQKETVKDYNQYNNIIVMSSDIVEKTNGSVDNNTFVEITTFTSGKSKTNGHKYFKNE